MNQSPDLFSICVSLRHGTPVEVDFTDILEIYNQAIKGKNYSDLQFVLEIFLRRFQVKTLNAEILPSLFDFCIDVVDDYNSELVVNANFLENHTLNLFKNTIVGTIDLAYYLKVKMPDKLVKKLELIEDLGIKYGLEKYKTLSF